MFTEIKNYHCRLCLSGRGRLIDILNPDADLDFAVEDVIRDLLQCHVEREIGYPWMVCQPCLEKVIEFHLFKIRCIECQVTFKRKFSTKDISKRLNPVKTGGNGFHSSTHPRATNHRGLRNIRSDLSSITTDEDETTNPSEDTNGLEASGNLLCHACGTIIDFSKVQSSRNVGHKKENYCGLFGRGTLQLAHNDGFEVVAKLQGDSLRPQKDSPPSKFCRCSIANMNEENSESETSNEIEDIGRVPSESIDKGELSLYQSDRDIRRNVLVLTEEDKRLILLFPKRDKEMIFVSQENSGCMFIIPTNAEPGMTVLSVAVSQGNEVLMTTEWIEKVIKMPLTDEASSEDVPLMSPEPAEHVDEVPDTQNQDEAAVIGDGDEESLSAAMEDEDQESAQTGDSNSEELMSPTEALSSPVETQDQIQPGNTSPDVLSESQDPIPLHSDDTMSTDERPSPQAGNITDSSSSSPDTDDQPINITRKGYLRSVITIPSSTIERPLPQYTLASETRGGFTRYYSLSNLRSSESRRSCSYSQRTLPQSEGHSGDRSVLDGHSRSKSAGRDRSTCYRKGHETMSGQNQSVDGTEEVGNASGSASDVPLNPESVDSMSTRDQLNSAIRDAIESCVDIHLSYILARSNPEELLREQTSGSITSSHTGSESDNPVSSDEVRPSALASHARLNQGKTMGVAFTKSDISDAETLSRSSEYAELSEDDDSQILEQVDSPTPSPETLGAVRSKVDDVPSIESPVEEKYRIKYSPPTGKQKSCVLIDLSSDSEQEDNVGTENSRKPRSIKGTHTGIFNIPRKASKQTSNVLIDLVSESEHEDVDDLGHSLKTNKLVKNVLVDQDFDSNDSEIVDIFAAKDCENVDELIESPVQDLNRSDTMSDDKIITSPPSLNGCDSHREKDMASESDEDDVADTDKEAVEDKTTGDLQEDVSSNSTSTDHSPSSPPKETEEESAEAMLQGDSNSTSASADEFQSSESNVKDEEKVLIYMEHEMKVLIFLTNNKHGEQHSPSEGEDKNVKMPSGGCLRKEILIVPLTEHHKNGDEGEFVLSNTDNDSITQENTRMKKSNTNPKPNSVVRKKLKERKSNPIATKKAKKLVYGVRDFGKQKIRPPRIKNLETGPSFQCKTCGEKYDTLPQYRKHYVRIHGKKQFGCGICPKRYKFIQNCVTHMLDHGGRMVYSCIYCDKNFKRRCTLNKHLITHSNQKTYRCKDCGKTFALRKSFNVHLRVHRKDMNLQGMRKAKGKPVGQEAQGIQVQNSTTNSDITKTHNCNLCKKTFPTASSLRTHKVRHIMIKRFGCVICGRSFLNQRRLRFHIMVHKEYKPFGCNICKKRFAKKSTLNCHLKKHLGPAPHVCQLCGKCLKSVKKMKIHMRSHRRESRLIQLIVDEK